MWNFLVITVKPLNSGHVRILTSLSVIERCSLLGDNLKKIQGMSAIWDVRYWQVSPYKSFLRIDHYVLFVTIDHLVFIQGFQTISFKWKRLTG